MEEYSLIDIKVLSLVVEANSFFNYVSKKADNVAHVEYASSVLSGLLYDKYHDILSKSSEHGWGWMKIVMNGVFTIKNNCSTLEEMKQTASKSLDKLNKIAKWRELVGEIEDGHQ